MLPNQKNFLNLIKTEKVCVMIAPAFVVDFKYPAIIGMLKKLGASMITELMFGARMTNIYYSEYIKNNPDQKYYITSPCPMVVSMIKTQYKDLMKYLIPVTSPMVSQAKILNYLYPNYKVVFVGPCRAKQNIEAKEYKDIIAKTLSFKDLQDIFDKNNIFEKDYLNCNDKFDLILDNETRIYPISGGLTTSAYIKNIINEDQILIDDGSVNLKNILKEIKNGTTKYRFFDLLNCDGGCISGAEIINDSLTLEDKKSRVLKYKTQMMDIDVSVVDVADIVNNIDFSRKF